MTNVQTYFLIKPVRFYADVNNKRTTIMEENRNRAIIYQWYCKITNKSYIGSGTKGSKRLIKY